MQRHDVVLNIDAHILASSDITLLINSDGAKLGTLHVSHGNAAWQPIPAPARTALVLPSSTIISTSAPAHDRKVSIMCLGSAQFEVTATGETFEVLPEHLHWHCESAMDLKLDTAYCHIASISYTSPASNTEVHIAWKVWESAAGLERKRKMQKDDGVTLLQNFLFGLAR